ncbi:MAG: glycosyltransferase family 10 domain-containing protein [Hoeflea sp.]|uniref:glycosyltransferase family 10 domain-containing protein n=1 Tax=Hoeflea sp. TaxID=1940281 RepID=UPI003EF28532
MTDSHLHANAPAVAVLPYNTRVTSRLAQRSLDDLEWPLGRPERLSQGSISDLKETDHIIAYVSSRLLYMPRPGIRAKVSVMVVEPKAVHGRNMACLRLAWWRFFAVLTCNPSLLGAIPNGVRFLFGSTWVPDWPETDMSKNRMLSLIASTKDYLEGHKLRHRTVDWIKSGSIDAEILGRGYAPFERKSDGLAPFRYSVIIENVRETSYFTEKLVDCLLCETVPIYWGAPDIGEIFDPRGMIVCTSFGDIQAAIASISAVDYQSRLEFIAKNKEKASRYAYHERAAARIVQAAAAQRTKSKP